MNLICFGLCHSRRERLRVCPLQSLLPAITSCFLSLSLGASARGRRIRPCAWALAAIACRYSVAIAAIAGAASAFDYSESLFPRVG